MTAVPKDLYIEQGTTFTFAFTWTDGVVDPVTSEVTAGAPKDLTGWLARMQIRESQGSPVIIDADNTNQKIILGLPAGERPGSALIDPTNGRITVWLTDEDTDLLSVKRAVYDLEVESPEGDVYRLLKGKVTTDPNITQEGGTEPVVVD
jgi:hypothetical protein